MSGASTSCLVPPAAAGEEKGREASPESPPGFLAIALRPGDCVPRHPLLKSYDSAKGNGTIIICGNGSCTKTIIVLDFLYEEYNENFASSCF
jgi:hypothetical protein